MANNWARKATEREREISVTLYHFYENFADLTSGAHTVRGFNEMVDEANKIQSKYPECQRTIIGIMEDINRMAKEHSQNG